jgi:2-oxoglutarate ferredoxin oxidoreductase subunit beta
MNTYGFHSIHGRAPAIATGLKVARPDLSVWVITGDGDGLSIGGNHLLHALRRNVDLNIILFNNQIYGLTKGQYSPTSAQQTRSPSTPMGSIDYPVNPISVALGAGATFVARCIDVEPVHTQQVIHRAAHHKGSAFVEILQNCNVFNDLAWEGVTGKAVKEEMQIRLEHGKPVLFGKDKKKGVRLNGFHPEIVTVGQNGVEEKDILVWDEKADPALAFMIAQLEPPTMPTPVGVLRAVDRPVHHELEVKQLEDVTAKKGAGKIEKLLHEGDTWTVS